MKVYGYIALSIAIFAILATLSSLVYSMNGIAALFIIGVIAAVPAVITYTSLGLNGEYGEESVESKRRWKIITDQYPRILIPIFGIAIFYVAYALLLRDARIFTLSSSFICLASAYWALCIFPKAKKLLSSIENEVQSSP